MTKILVTGGTGFVGQHLIKALVGEKGEVFALVRDKGKAKNLEKMGTKVILGDLNSAEFLKKIIKDIDCDIVYHLAVLRSEWHQWDEFYQNNVFTTENLLKALKGQIKHFIFISSVSVLGYPGTLPIDESYPINPETLYAKSKAEGEKLVLEFFKKGLPVTIVRPAVIYGPGDKYGMFFKLVHLIRKNWFVIFGRGESHLHMVYIDDLISGLLKVGKINPKGQIYILAGEKPITVNQLVNFTSGVLAKKSSFLHLPVWFGEMAGWLSEKIWFWGEPLVTRRKVDHLIKDQIYNIFKAKRELGFEPKVSYKEGIKKTIKWYQDNGYF